MDFSRKWLISYLISRLTLENQRLASHYLPALTSIATRFRWKSVALDMDIKNTFESIIWLMIYYYWSIDMVHEFRQRQTFINSLWLMTLMNFGAKCYKNAQRIFKEKKTRQNRRFYYRKRNLINFKLREMKHNSRINSRNETQFSKKFFQQKTPLYWSVSSISDA